MHPNPYNEVFDILDDLPVIGEKVKAEGEKIWLQCKEKVKEQEVPEVPNPIEMIQNQLKGGGAGGLIDVIKVRVVVQVEHIRLKHIRLTYRVESA